MVGGSGDVGRGLPQLAVKYPRARRILNLHPKEVNKGCLHHNMSQQDHPWGGRSYNMLDDSTVA